MSNSGYEVLTESLIQATVQKAKSSPRKRQNYNFHQASDSVQRMLNALEPDSYVRPHRHLNPPKVEHFVVLQGSLAVLIFNDQGRITDTLILDCRKSFGIDIKPGVWHSIVGLVSGTVIFETKDGPYIQATDKDFALWAPEENTPESRQFLAMLKNNLGVKHD
jgi:cupin fold WbuC family metalloprotein